MRRHRISETAATAETESVEPTDVLEATPVSETDAVSDTESIESIVINAGDIFNQLAGLVSENVTTETLTAITDAAEADNTPDTAIESPSTTPANDTADDVSDTTETPSETSIEVPAEQPISGISAIPDTQIYVVVEGDSLSEIAAQLYGDIFAWTKLYDANREIIGDNPDLIEIGMELVVP